MQSVSSRIWTCVAVFISYDDNHYIELTLSDRIIKSITSSNHIALKEKWKSCSILKHVFQVLPNAVDTALIDLIQVEKKPSSNW